MKRVFMRKTVSALLILVFCVGIFNTNTALAEQYPVEVGLETVYTNNLSSVDYTGSYNDYGYSYVYWYSVANKKLKIVFPDNNYQEKTYTVTIPSASNVLGAYKNYIVYYTVSGTTKYIYKVDINTGSVTLVTSKDTGSGTIIADLSDEGLVALVTGTSYSYKVFAYDLSTDTTRYYKTYNSLLREYNEDYYINQGMAVDANGKVVMIEEKYRGSNSNYTYHSYSYLSSTGTRVEGPIISTDTYGSSSVYASAMATKAGFIVLKENRDTEDDESASYVYVNDDDYYCVVYGRINLVNTGRYVGVPQRLLVGNDTDNAGILYEDKSFSGNDGSDDYSLDVFYADGKTFYGMRYRDEVVEFTVNESSKTISKKIVDNGDMTESEYDSVNDRIYTVEFTGSPTEIMRIYEKQGSGFVYIGSADYTNLPDLTEVGQRSYNITSTGLAVFNVKFTEDVVRDVVSEMDMTPPSVFVRTDPEGYTSSPTIWLIIDAIDNKDPYTQLTMSISTNGGSSYSNWEPYKSTKQITLPTSDGEKTIAVMVKDSSGNVGMGICTITLGTSAPPSDIGQYNLILEANGATVDKILYNGEYVYPVKTRSLSLTMDAKNAVDIKINDNESNPADGTYQKASIASGKINHTLALKDYDGIQTYFIQLRNASLAESSPMEINIMLDRQAPEFDVGPFIKGQSATTQNKIDLKITAKDNVSSILTYRINNGTWATLPSDGKVNYSGLSVGYNNLKVEVKDLVGNTAEKYIEIFRLN